MMLRDILRVDAYTFKWPRRGLPFVENVRPTPTLTSEKSPICKIYPLYRFFWGGFPTNGRPLRGRDCGKMGMLQMGDLSEVVSRLDAFALFGRRCALRHSKFRVRYSTFKKIPLPTGPPAPIAAILNLSPHLFPFFAPGKWPPADDADFLR
jgi:hypothetical protein